MFHEPRSECEYAADEPVPSLEDSLARPRASSGEEVQIAAGAAPGGFAYSGGGYIILELMIEDVTGEDYADFTRQRLLGPLGMRFLLGEPVFATAHSYFGTLSLSLYLGTAYLGRKLRLAPGREDIRQIHAFCAFIAVFVSLLVAILGFQLLP